MKINVEVEVPDGKICWGGKNNEYCLFFARTIFPVHCRLFDVSLGGGPVRGYKKCQACLDAKVVIE